MKKVLVIVLGVVLVVGVLGLSFYAGIKFANYENEKGKTTVEENIKEEKKQELEEVLDVKNDDDNYIVNKANSFIPRYLCGGYELRLDGNSLKVSDLKDKEKLAMLMNGLLNDFDWGEDNIKYEENDFKKYFDDLSFLELVKNAGKEGYKLGPIKLTYKNNKYEFFAYATGCENMEFSEDHLFLNKAVKKGDKLILTYDYAYWKQIVLDPDADDIETKLIFYKDKKDSTPIFDDVKRDDDSNDYLVDWSKLNKYEFVFDIKSENMKLLEINFIEAK